MPVRTVDYATQTFLPPCLEDLVSGDHPARYIRDVVDEMDLDELGFDTSYEPDGRARIAADTLLKLWLYGYYSRVRSTRKLEHFSGNDMGALFLCGMQPPDHTTLWRFWNKHREAIGNLFKLSVQVAVKAGLVNLQFLAVDGTNIVARSSRRTGWKKEQLDKQLSKLDEYLKSLESQISESGLDEPALVDLQGSFKNAEGRKVKIAQAIAELDQRKINSTHPHEPDAAVMNCEGRRQWAYNCQAVVDDGQGIVVAADVTNEANEQQCLTRMMDQAVGNLDGSKPELFVLDAAYGRSEEAVNMAMQAGHNFVTARSKDEKQPYHRSRFAFDREKLELICPLGFKLLHTGALQRKTGGRVERFRCLHWEQCGARSACYGKSKNGRHVEVSALHEVMNAHRQQVTAYERRMLMRKRFKTIEPIFAFHKEHDGFRRFLFFSRAKAKAQWLMSSCVRNLKVLRKVWKTKDLAWS